MAEGEEYYLIPIELGFFKYPDLLDGSIHIEHIDEINEYLSIAMENRARMREASGNNG